MFYHPFRSLVNNLLGTCSSILEQGEPDQNEQVPLEVVDFIAICQEVKKELDKIQLYLQEDVEDPVGAGFGPVLDPKELQTLISVVLPLAVKLDNTCPLISYLPAWFLREKSLFLLEVINLYIEWKSYFEESTGPKVLEPQRFISMHMEHVKLIDENSKILDLLFRNLRFVSKQAELQLEQEFSKPIGQI